MVPESKSLKAALRSCARFAKISSYASASDPRPHFGFGPSDRAVDVEIRWPSGMIDRIKNVAVDQLIHVVEGSHEKATPRTACSTFGHPVATSSTTAQICRLATGWEHQPLLRHGRRDNNPRHWCSTGAVQALTGCANPNAGISDGDWGFLRADPTVSKWFALRPKEHQRPVIRADLWVGKPLTISA